ncbi:PREDICTED: transmembrane protein 25 isoform X1 [Sturnus vulgaris]|uniref:transmembrane protein 25 isoform X1 n=1 Tax=Sturnus vulgaris TaxID=9172 RepID=UPI00071A02B7|nr:PREDICTED: transmembrane protein 25 isoform X1 [Sturnus vulgaris]XP_014740195.1 PREDICTED: transmembrane protein 25 isoform X1 [Sturnus vulgaris]
MGCPRGWPRAALALLLLLLLSLLALCLAALEELDPTTDGQPRAACTLQEGESRIFTCWVPRPVPGATLAWYLNGQKQEVNLSTAGTDSILTLNGQHSDHQLNCSLTNPTSSETYNTSILLNVQCKVRGASLLQTGMWEGHVGPLSSSGRTITHTHDSHSRAASCQSCANEVDKSLSTQARQILLLAVLPSSLLPSSLPVFYPDKPEILREGARYQQVEDTGLLLVLFVLVQANPPTSITWVDQDGHVMANTSKFLLLGTTSYPGLANHSLHIHLSCTAGNLSVSAANSVGITTASLLPTGLLDARVELPVLGVAIGAALALAALLSLGSCAACLACHLPKLVQGPGQAGGNSPPSQCSHCSSSEPPQPQGTRLPRQTRSLPPNLRLGDLAQEDGASPKDAGAGAKGEETALLELENSLVFSKLGFVQLPKSGRIYKVPSMSSDEIWL